MVVPLERVVVKPGPNTATVAREDVVIRPLEFFLLSSDDR